MLRELVSLSERETIVDVILFAVNWHQVILIYAVIVSSHSAGGQLKSRNSSRQMTGAPIRLQSSSTVKTRRGIGDNTVTGEQDHVLIEKPSQKK